MIASRGYCNNSTVENIDQDWQLFSQNIELLLEHKQTILNCSPYFFVTIPGAFCSYPFINTDGILFLGYLIMGWEQNILTDICIKCHSTVLVFWFCGSILSGRNQWKGICLNCRNEQLGQWQTFGPRWQLVSELRKKYPDKISEWEEYDGVEFTFAGNGLRPARKKKLIWRQLAEPISLQTLVNELNSGVVRPGKPVNVHLLKKDFELKLSSNAKSPTIYITCPP